MKINTDIVKELREKTGAGVIDIKEALEKSGGDMNRAVDFLRKKGEKIVQKKQARQTHQGLVVSYMHTNNRVAALVAIACETDFVARNEEFKNLAKDIAMQVVAFSPTYLEPSEVPPEILEKEKEIMREQLKAEGKPEKIREKIMAGKINKFYEEVCLLKQPFIKDDKKTIDALIKEKIAILGENIKIRRFVRLSLD
ncbi:MAG: translation elongation factor Ts [Patescibacteria group bacterium]